MMNDDVYKDLPMPNLQARRRRRLLLLLRQTNPLPRPVMTIRYILDYFSYCLLLKS